jgi:CubicO group peptidase (beta-lactamase class C family)
MTQSYAAGALVSTVDDLARWDAAISAGKLLNAESWKQVFSPFKLKNGRTTKYAYGWVMGPTRPFQTFEHGGAIPGFVSYAVRVPEKQLFVAVLANDDGGDLGFLNFLRVLWNGRMPAALTARVMKTVIDADQAVDRA